MSLRVAPAQEMRNPESDGLLDLDLSLGVRSKADQIICREAVDDRVTESDFCLSLNASSNPWSDKITRLREKVAYRKKKEQEVSEMIRTKKTSTLDLTL